MIDHLKVKHPQKPNKDVAYFRDLKVKFEKRSTIGGLFKSCGNEVEKRLVASHKTLKLIAKCGKSHIIGETLYYTSSERNHQYYNAHSKRCNTFNCNER